jgi:hypothetical protein
MRVFEEIAAVRAACGDAHLKFIPETGELVTLDNVRRASWLALLAGGDFIKTSTGKMMPAATEPVALVMMEAVRDFAAATGQLRGLKANNTPYGLSAGIWTEKGSRRHTSMSEIQLSSQPESGTPPDRVRVCKTCKLYLAGRSLVRSQAVHTR